MSSITVSGTPFVKPLVSEQDVAGVLFSTEESERESVWAMAGIGTKQVDFSELTKAERFKLKRAYLRFAKRFDDCRERQVAVLFHRLATAPVVVTRHGELNPVSEDANEAAAWAEVAAAALASETKTALDADAEDLAITCWHATRRIVEDNHFLSEHYADTIASNGTYIAAVREDTEFASDSLAASLAEELAAPRRGGRVRTLAASRTGEGVDYSLDGYSRFASHPEVSKMAEQLLDEYGANGDVCLVADPVTKDFSVVLFDGAHKFGARHAAYQALVASAWDLVPLAEKSLMAALSEGAKERAKNKKSGLPTAKA